MLKANRIVRAEIEVISVFLECRKDFDKLRLCLVDAEG
jgi:hypothetical protein